MYFKGIIELLLLFYYKSIDDNIDLTSKNFKGVIKDN